MNDTLFSFTEGRGCTEFGYTMESQPKDNSNEVLDQALYSVKKGLPATKIASSMGENAGTFGEIAAQKAAELGVKSIEQFTIQELLEEGIEIGIFINV